MPDAKPSTSIGAIRRSEKRWLKKEGGLAPSAAVFCMWTPDPPLGLTLPRPIAYIES
jgi:hypothetical protein